MKDKLVSFITLFISFVSFAQDNVATTSENKYRLGVKLGLASASIHVNDRGSNGRSPAALTSRTGFVAGGYCRIRLKTMVAFQPEIQFISKGWHEENYVTYTSNYLELPLNLLYTSYGKKGSTFYIGGGPAPSVNLGENFYFGSYTTPKQFDLGLNFLMGYEISIGFALNVHYTHGLLNINTISDGPVIKNRCVGLTIGYTF